jgi:hypothetical protein
MGLHLAAIIAATDLAHAAGRRAADARHLPHLARNMEARMTQMQKAQGR